jgi:hypothetical protein
MASLFAGVGPLSLPWASGATLSPRRLTLSNSVPGVSGTYEISITIPSSAMLGSIKAEFCDNTALFQVACNAPAGFDISAATLSGQSGETGFVIDPLTNANTLILSRAPTLTPGGVTVILTLDNVHNASALGSQYARFSVFPTNDASGADTDRGSVAYALNPNLNVTAEVPPFLIYCVGVTITNTDCNTATGNYVNMGNFSTVAPTSGQTQMVVGTNAGNGYSIVMSGNTMASGNNTLPALSSPTVSAPGISQFGVNMRANTIPVTGQDPSGAGISTPSANYNQPNRYMFHSGDVLASSTNVEDFRKFTITYLVNISTSQPPGVYASSFTYVGTGNF